MAESNVPTTYDASDSKFVTRRIANIKSDLIEITHDKLENILLKHLSSVSVKGSWITPSGILLSVLLTLCTAEFKEFWGVSKESWQAVFIVLAIVSGGWLIYSLVRIYQCWGKMGLEHLLSEIKKLV